MRSDLATRALPVLGALAAALTASLLLAQAPAAQFAVPAHSAAHWFKGNTHTHTLNSDGDSPPEYVARWYKDHGYNFLILTDHDQITDPAELSQLQGEDFLLIPGEEVTAQFENKAVHVNGLNVQHVVEPRKGKTLVETIQNNVDAVRAAGGIPELNHPNFLWSFGAQEISQVTGVPLLEIFNGVRTVHNYGGGGYPSMEEMWDSLLTGGMRIYGVADDDAHRFQGEFGTRQPNPGRGWVVVRADSLDAAELMQSLASGQFYASTGVELEDVVVEPHRLEVHIAAETTFRYTTTFIGSGGRELAVSVENPAVYRLQGGEGYVRAKVTDSSGAAAFVQPVFVDR